MDSLCTNEELQKNLVLLLTIWVLIGGLQKTLLLTQGAVVGLSLMWR
jgi:hypothetical protein